MVTVNKTNRVRVQTKQMDGMERNEMEQNGLNE